MDNKEVDILLEKNFSNVNSWLNFAEAKNAANIAFIVATFTVILESKQMNILSYLMCGCLVVSGICSLLSFCPKLNKESKNFNWEKTQTDNLLFFEDIKKYEKERYIEEICVKYFNSAEIVPTKYQLDLASEIIYNSCVASRKYRLFKYAVITDIITFLLLGVLLILG